MIAPRPEHAGEARPSWVVVLPALWAPLHHRPAIVALSEFVQNYLPDKLMFLSGPSGMSEEARAGFITAVAGFREVYAGPVGVQDCDAREAERLRAMDVAILPGWSPVVPGWMTMPPDPTQAESGPMRRAQDAGENLVSGGTGRLRLTGRAIPAQDGGVARAWLVLECGTLAADPASGTLGFGVLETINGFTTARPVSVGANGSFTFHGTRHTARPTAVEPA